MGIWEMKRDIREKIMSYQYNGGTEDVLELLDTYDRYLSMQGTADELAEAAFFRGDIAFHKGRYQETIEALTNCLGIEKTLNYTYLETESYNLLGMLFSFAGYENVALNNYLRAYDSAKKDQSVQGQVAALLNSGILYQSLQDYRKAMSYYKRAYEAAGSNFNHPEMYLLLLCLIQQAQVLYLMGRYEDVKRMKREIDSYYQVTCQGEVLLPKSVLEVWMEEKFGTERHMLELIEQIRQYLSFDERYVEQIDVYVDFCEFLIEKNRKTEARQFLDALREKVSVTEFFELRMRLESLEVLYQKRFGSEEQYLEYCRNYRAIQHEYEGTLHQFKQQNLDNIENLQELEQQRTEFEYRSKCDLATGLLNKEAFRIEVEKYLEERNRGVTDAMVVLDIDDFKLVNDSFGHLVGDEVIFWLAGAIKERFDKDLTGRFGGDEFLIFVRGIADVGELEERVENLREAFSKHLFGKNASVQATISVGVSYNTDMDASYQSMLSCADEALLKAKEYGKNRVTFFEIKRGMLKYV